ncbi:hypothetical protein K378_01392 [Streptomyces sp. Amel2xB2]|uniref:hypothetical protein n=1 Tax=Streptomyces sp. Amel2xB2 TaxID=1305829 RepID=UPI000DBA9431|nr:hypothetical protein [Streptomyces sp. Amel2xB2]RAJ70227.1 hypothetical protein K378_01392 [Streptomyces sp. Amel2xB2]
MNEQLELFGTTDVTGSGKAKPWALRWNETSSSQDQPHHDADDCGCDDDFGPCEDHPALDDNQRVIEPSEDAA